MNTESLRESVDRIIDHIEMTGFSNGFDSCLNALDELSNQLHNDHQHEAAETLRWVVKELKGENIDKEYLAENL